MGSCFWTILTLQCVHEMTAEAADQFHVPNPLLYGQRPLAHLCRCWLGPDIPFGDSNVLMCQPGTLIANISLSIVSPLSLRCLLSFGLKP